MGRGYSAYGPAHGFCSRWRQRGRHLYVLVDGLPNGLALDPHSGCIVGVIKSLEKKEYAVTLHVQNAHGEGDGVLRIVVGDRIALTPPMGWNSWNCWAGTVDETKVRASAEAMARLLKGHGWTYVNIDDSWQGERGGDFNAIQPNSKFANMKGMADYVHGLGLKLGIYSTPWITSYAGFCGGSSDNADGKWIRPPGKAERATGFREGRYTFEMSNAKQWEAWGIDYLKYDWHPIDLAATDRMAKALAAQQRDIVYSLSNRASFDRAADYALLCNCWRTGNDIRDDWDRGMRSPNGFEGIYDIWLLQERWAFATGPGHWPDPDMLVVGRVGWGPNLHPSRLTPDEQYTHISLWCLWSAPLLIGCPIENMDAFTLNLLTNDEVLALDQDPLGRMAVTVLSDGDRQVLAKPLEDGSVAVGLFNRSKTPLKVTVPWALLRFDIPRQRELWRYSNTDIMRPNEQRCRVRDLWRQRDIGVFAEGFSAMVPAHGVVLVRVEPAE